MGNGSSKPPFLKRHKRYDKGSPCFKRLQELKQEEIQQLHDGCVSPNFGKNGLAFYAPLNDLSSDERRHGFENKPKLSSEKHQEASFSDSFGANEREIIADVIVEQHLQEKSRKAKLAEEKRLLVISRREKKEEEIKKKYEAKMKMEERKQEVQNRLRPPNSEVRSFRDNKKNANYQKL